MRFKGTLVLLALCAGLGAYLYFYEFKGGERREKAKEAEAQVWKLDAKDVAQIDLTTPDRNISATRAGGKWTIIAPRAFQADSDELNRIAHAASNIRREGVVETNAASLSRFGLDPAVLTLRVRTADGKTRSLMLGISNPSGSYIYAAVRGSREVLLVNSSVLNAFNKTVDDLRNHQILSFDQQEVQSLSIRSAKGALDLVKDADDRWWIAGEHRIAADSPGVRGMLNALSLGRIAGFPDGAPETLDKLGLDKPLVDVRLTYGKQRIARRLAISPARSAVLGRKQPGLETTTPSDYVAKDDSRPDLFFVEKDLVDKLAKSPEEVRERALAAFQRWDVDFVSLINQKGNVTFVKSNGEWFVGKDRKKAKWDDVNALLDVLEKPVKNWILKPAALSAYGLDSPAARLVLKQRGKLLVDCAFGKAAQDGVYAQVQGDPAVKVADLEGLNALNKAETEFVENSAKK